MSASRTLTAITVQWESVPCNNQNGNITGYSIRYGAIGSGETDSTRNTTDHRVTLVIIETSASYSIQVAAVTSAGVGAYSSPIVVDTHSKLLTHLIIHFGYFSFLLVVLKLMVLEATTTSILMGWNVTNESTVILNRYILSYRNTEYTDCFNITNTISINSTLLSGQYNIESLQEGTNYSITLHALSDGVKVGNSSLQCSTNESGKI